MMTQDGAIDALAECLYLRFERLDPTGRGAWPDLLEEEREYYRKGIREILLEKTLLALAMGVSRDSPTTT